MEALVDARSWIATTTVRAYLEDRAEQREIPAAFHEAGMYPSDMEECLRFFEALRTLVRDNNIRVDLHGHNAMIRPSTGEWVMTDPMCTRDGRNRSNELAERHYREKQERAQKCAIKH